MIANEFQQKETKDTKGGKSRDVVTFTAPTDFLSASTGVPRSPERERVAGGQVRDVGLKPEIAARNKVRYQVSDSAPTAANEGHEGSEKSSSSLFPAVPRFFHGGFSGCTPATHLVAHETRHRSPNFDLLRRRLKYIGVPVADVAELADALDSKFRFCRFFPLSFPHLK